jgi:hypothetical protein
MIWHRCGLKQPSLFGPACCGRKATTYDRARKAWLCPDIRKTGCVILPIGTALGQLCYVVDDALREESRKIKTSSIVPYLQYQSPLPGSLRSTRS